MNTRGIMLKFLLSVILAIIIFAPACILTSKFFRLSAQAKDNFADLHSEIEMFAKKASVGDYTGFMIIVDDETYVAKFDANEDIRVPLTWTYQHPLSQSKQDQYFEERFPFSFKYPAQCQGKDCFVLCTELSFDYSQKEVTCAEAVVKEAKKETYTVPFLVVRHLLKEADELKARQHRVDVNPNNSPEVSANYKVMETVGPSARRTPIALSKDSFNNNQGKIIVSGDGVFYGGGSTKESEAVIAKEANAYQIETRPVEFVSGTENSIILKITVLLPLQISSGFPTKLELKGNQQAGLNDIIFNSGFVISGNSLEFELPLVFKTPGIYDIKGEVNFAYQSKDIGFPKWHIPVAWRVTVK